MEGIKVKVEIWIYESILLKLQVLMKYNTGQVVTASPGSTLVIRGVQNSLKSPAEGLWKEKNMARNVERPDIREDSEVEVTEV